MTAACTMRLRHVPCCLGLLLIVGCASPAPKGGGTVSLRWEAPEQFTDFVPVRAESSYSLIQEQRRLENELIDLADAYIPEGCNVRITFRDIDRAGWIDPVAPRPIRIVSDQWPARVEFDFQVTDTAGEALQHGHETLSLMFPQFLRSKTEPESEMPDIQEMFRPWFRQLGRQLPKLPKNG
jgi:hypothetical protein